ncbi:g3331 [Coccomyxa viridis]|uniref:G3331 protein n=1 Tax=Coccomyxa viridis TaxID=1274662 RepID=A0ABP1FMI6_9CHLO
MSDRKVLDYHDVLLYAGDVELLRGPQWLNDQVIAFYFEYLGREKFSGKGLAYCPGCLTFLLLQSDPAELPHIIAPLKLVEKRLVFLACNDNPDVNTANGGSHWSLLVYDGQERQYMHYDSSAGSNDVIAKTLARQLGKAGLPGDYQSAKCPRQANGHDCGVYVLAITDAISELHSGNRSWQELDKELSERVTPAAIAQLRKDTLQLIMNKSKNKVPAL